MTWAAVQRKGKGAANVTTLSIGSGDGWATPTSGNLLVVTANSDATVSTPSGWTAGPSVVDGNGAYIFYKISAGSESTITITPGASANTAMTVAEYSGNAASPFDTSNTSTIAGSSGNTTTSVSVTTAQSGDLIIAAALIHSAISSNPTSPTWTNSFVNQISASSGATTPTCDSFVAELIAGAAGAYSTAASWTNNANDRQELVIAFTAATTAAFAPYPQGRRRFVPPRYTRPLPRVAMPVPPQLNPPYPPAGVKHPLRVRALLPRVGGAAKPVPPQLLPPYPPAGVMHPGRLRNLLARRGRSAQVVPAQVVVTAPAFIPQAVHSRVKAYAARRRPAQFMPPDQPGVIQTVRARLKLPRLTRSHIVQSAPAQTAPPPPSYVPQGFRARVRSLRLFRARTAQPVPQQVVVPPPTFVPNRARQATVRAATARRGHAVAPPVAQAPAPLFTRIKLRAVRVFRGKPRPVVPAQVVIVQIPTHNATSTAAAAAQDTSVSAVGPSTTSSTTAAAPAGTSVSGVAANRTSADGVTGSATSSPSVSDG